MTMQGQRGNGKNTNVRGSAKGQTNNIAHPTLVGKNQKKGGATGSTTSTTRVSQHC